MNSKTNNKPMDKKSMVIMWVIIAAIMVFAVASDGEAVIPAVGTMIMVTVIVLISGAANKKAANKSAADKNAVPAAKPGQKSTPRVFQHPDDPEVEEAVRCQHATGKEKYIQQLDSYLKAGLIDKAEYKLMKERYQKLEIPEDYH